MSCHRARGHLPPARASRCAAAGVAMAVASALCPLPAHAAGAEGGLMGPPAPAPALTAAADAGKASPSHRDEVAAPAAEANGPAGEAARAGAPAGAADVPEVYTRAEPPLTAYDRLEEPGRPRFSPESLALMQQLGRTVMALCFTVALIYIFFRLGLPRVTRLWLKQSQASYVVRERLAIDTKNSLVKIEGEGGEAYLLGVNDACICLLEKWPPPPGGPLANPSRPKQPFSEALRPEPKGSAS